MPTRGEHASESKRLARALRRAKHPDDPILTVAGLTLTRGDWEALDDESVALLLEILGGRDPSPPGGGPRG